MTTELAVQTVSKFDHIMRLAEMSTANGTYGQKTHEVATKMWVAESCGFDPVRVASKIYMINNVASLDSELLLAMVRRSPHLNTFNIEKEYHIQSGLIERVTVTASRFRRVADVPDNEPLPDWMYEDRNLETYSHSYSMTEARKVKHGKIQLTDKDNWQNWPVKMLIWRAAKSVLQVLFPDVLQGAISIDEAEEIEANDFERVTVHQPQPLQIETVDFSDYPQFKEFGTLEPADLYAGISEKYTIDKVMGTGIFPVTLEDMSKLLDVLNGVE